MKKLFVLLSFVMALKGDILFEDMVSRIMKNHSSIASSNEAIKGAEEAVGGAIWQYFPTPSIDMSRNGSAAATTFKLEQPLWTGGRLDANYNLALSSKAESMQVLEENKYKLLETILGYCQNYIEAKYIKEALQESLLRLDGFSEMIDRKISAGASSLSDKRLLEARITQIKADLISNQFKESISLKQLGILLGEEITDINFSDSFSIDNINKDELIKKVSFSNPTLAKIDEQIRSAGFEIDKQKASLYPTLGVSAEHVKGSVYDEKSTTNENLVYFKLQSNFGAGLSLFSNIEQSKIKLQKLKYDRSTYENQLIDLFWQDYNNMMVSKSKMSNFTVSKQLSKEVFESNKRLFLADRKQWLDLVNSSKELMDAGISFANSKVIYMMSKYKVALRTGLLDINNAQYTTNIEKTYTTDTSSTQNIKEVFPEKKEEKQQIKNITFKRDDVLIDEKFINDLKNVAIYMNKNKDFKLQLIGHSDKTAKATSEFSKNYNKELAQKRAQSIANWLISNGVEQNRVTVISKGFETPLQNNDSEIGNELNRRVEFVYMSNDGKQI